MCVCVCVLGDLIFLEKHPRLLIKKNKFYEYHFFTADAISSKNKQKTSQSHTNASRKFQENIGEEKRITVKMQEVTADEINLRNKQKNSQLQINCSGQFQQKRVKKNALDTIVENQGKIYNTEK